MFDSRAARALLVALLVSPLLGCAVSAHPTDGRILVVTSAYPVEFVVRQVAGDRADVRSLARPGVEPHDLELTPRQVALVADADLVVQLRGFQPAVDAAVTAEAQDRSLDIAPAAHLLPAEAQTEEVTGAGDPADGHSGEVATGAGESGAFDPHFWLDPIRLASVATAIASRLSRLDPVGAPGYRERAARLTTRLGELDGVLRAGLSGCEQRVLVTAHTAFGYLARRYGLRQVGVLGLSPDAEPEPGVLAAVTRVVRTERVSTVYAERLGSPALARTLAHETGAHLAVLDPVETAPTGGSGGTADYFTAMRADLTILRKGQSCP